MFDLAIFLQCLSWSAIITTISLFLCGIPICVRIFRHGTNEITPVPFLMGLIGASFWLRYGLLKGDNTMIIVNFVGAICFSCYCVFYLFFAKPKCNYILKLSLVLSTMGGMLVYIHYTPDIDLLGFACMTFNIINFGAPLAGLGVVLRKRCCDSLPLPMCVANLLVSSQWFLYGNIVQDSYIMAPNGIGMALAVLQLSLFIIFPMNIQGTSIISRCFKSKNLKKKPFDPELGAACSPCSPSLESRQTSSSELSATMNSEKRSRSNSFADLSSTEVEVAVPIRPRTNSMPDASKFKFT